MTRPILWLDTETFNEVDLDVGAYVYALTAEILIVSYAIQDGPAQVWDVTSGAPAPEALISALANPDYLVYAHNSPFDRPMLEHNKIGLPVPPRERWRCTMAQALTNALPAGLDDLCRVLRVPQDQAKLAIGTKLINRFCKPAPANHKARRYDRNTHPELWAQFCEYARQDIVAMRECHRRMPDWNYRGQELDAWLLDQKINDRGFFVDKPFVDAAVRATEEEKARIAARFQELTHYQVEKPSKRDQFLAYLNDTYLLGLDNTRAETLRGLVARGDTPDELRELLEIAIESNKTSTSKYARLQQAIDPRDGRFRGGLQFAGAGRTRRWAGRIFQPQNLPSRGLPPAASVETYIEAVKVGMHTVLFDDLMKYGAAALRGAVLASPGKAIRAADLSNIEGRMLAWFAGEEWKLKAFRDYDAGVGPDLYNITANMIIGVDPWKVPKKLRNVFGKVPDLACFGANTLVLTDTGLKKIVDVQPEDRVWDGQEWVCHAGVVDRGERPVINLAGIEVTPDHLIRTGATWTQAQELVSSESMLFQALETGSANLPWSGLTQDRVVVCTPYWSAVAAKVPGSTLSHLGILGLGELLGATSARRRPQAALRSDTSGMPTSCQTKRTDAGCSTVSQPASTDAGTRTTPRTGTTEGGESGLILSGRKTEGLFSGISSRWRGGISRHLSLIASTWTKGISRAICGSFREEKTGATNGLSQTSKNESINLRRVYDVACAGPRTRFTIWTDRGWLLVHNSGYQGGVRGYQTFARAYGVKMADHWDTICRSIVEEIRAAARKNLAKDWAKQQVEELGISELEWLASETCKIAWRRRHPATVKFWYDLQDAVKQAIQQPGQVFVVTKLKVSVRVERGFRWLLILLPSGNRLCYFEPGLTEDGSIFYWGMSEDEGSTTKVWTRVFTHGGKLTGNVCQTTARDLLTYNMPSIEGAGYDILMTVHDEVVTESPIDSPLDDERLARLMSWNPPWAPDIPLAADGFSAPRYKKED